MQLQLRKRPSFRKNVTGTTNSLILSSHKKEKTAKDGKKYETFKAVETYRKYNYSYNGSYDDGKRLVIVDPNSRYGSASRKKKLLKMVNNTKHSRSLKHLLAINYFFIVNQ